MDSEILDRIKIVMVRKHTGSVTAWSKVIDVKQQILDRTFKGMTKPSLDLVDKILAAYPEISAEWLLRGKGNMHGIDDESADREAVLRSQQTDLEVLEKKLARQSEEIADLTTALKRKNEIIKEFSKV